MKEKLIQFLNLKYKCSTKWNDIYDGEKYTLIYNRATKDFRIKTKF